MKKEFVICSKTFFKENREGKENLAALFMVKGSFSPSFCLFLHMYGAKGTSFIFTNLPRAKIILPQL